MFEGNYEREISRDKKTSEQRRPSVYAEDTARRRLERSTQPEAMLEAGQESEHGRNDKAPKKEPQRLSLSADEMAARRLEIGRSDDLRAKELREKILSKF